MKIYKAYTKDKKFEEYNPPELESLDYYRSLPLLVNYLAKKGVKPGDISSVKIYLLENAVLHEGVFKIAELKDKENRTVLEIITKMHYPLKEGVVQSTKRYPTKDNSSLEIKNNLEDSIKREFEHLKFWNLLELNVPPVFGYLEKAVSINKQEYIINGILMEYLNKGATHDINLLGIEQELKRIPDGLKDKFFSLEDKEKLKANDIILKNEKTKLLKNSLSAIVGFSINSTFYLDFLDADNQTKDMLQLNPPSEKYIIDKGVYYFNKIVVWNLIKSGSLEIEQIIGNKVQRSKLHYILNAQKKFKKRFKDIAKDMADTTKLLYVHGDEYLHHIKYIGSDENIKTILFDGCRAGLGRIEKSLARLMLSEIVDLSYNECVKLVEGAFEEFNQKSIDLVGRYIKILNNDKLKKYTIEPEEGLKNFDRFGLYEIITLMGKIAQRDIQNKANTQERGQFPFVYNQEVWGGQIKFPDLNKPKLVVFDINEKPDIYINKISGKLKKRLCNMIKGNTPYKLDKEELDNLVLLKNMCEKYKLIEDESKKL